MRDINSLLGCAFLFGAISFALAANAADVEVTFYTPSIARIVRAPNGEVVKKADIVTAKPQKVKMSVLENDDAKTWKSAALSVRLDKKTGALSFLGADGAFELYEDSGDGYDYEKGVFTTVGFSWNDKTKTLTIGARKGAYPGMLKSRTFRVKTLGGAEKAVKYGGKAVKVSL